MSYYFEMPDGTRLTQEQYNEQKAKKIDEEIAAEHQAQNESARLTTELSEAYKACAGFMARNPKLCKKVGDAEAQEHELYLKLRQNLERADEAPRCEKVRVDGTVCECPRMTGYSYCYAHERMLQARPRKLALPALEDPNSIQLAIMLVQKALIDDEISEKKAGLLLYSMQIAASNVSKTTFISEYDKEVVTEMPEEEALSTWPLALSKSQDNIHRGDAEAVGSGTSIAKTHHGDAETRREAGNTYHGDTEARRKAAPGDLVIGGSGDLVIGQTPKVLPKRTRRNTEGSSSRLG